MTENCAFGDLTYIHETMPNFEGLMKVRVVQLIASND